MECSGEGLILLQGLWDASRALPSLQFFSSEILGIFFEFFLLFRRGKPMAGSLGVGPCLSLRTPICRHRRRLRAAAGHLPAPGPTVTDGGETLGEDGRGAARCPSAGDALQTLWAFQPQFLPVPCTPSDVVRYKSAGDE